MNNDGMVDPLFSEANWGVLKKDFRAVIKLNMEMLAVLKEFRGMMCRECEGTCTHWDHMPSKLATVIAKGELIR